MSPVRPGVIALFLLLLLPLPVRAQVSDEQLGQEAVEAVLTYANFTIFDDITIGVDNRVVTLFGRVTTPAKKDAIEKRVAQIDGIRELRNEIGVLPLSQADSTLRTQVALNIYRHPAFWRYAQQANPPIHIIVEHQRITLTGEVDSEVDRMLAYSLAQVSGALNVTNDLRVAGSR